jgi:small subunit ribosomal protein S16
VIKLRLRRMGAKHQPTYRIVAAEARSPRDGRFIEVIGFYNPRSEPAQMRVDADRAKYWLEHGAQPTDTVRSILRRSGILPDEAGRANGTTGTATATPTVE